MSRPSARDHGFVITDHNTELETTVKKDYVLFEKVTNIMSSATTTGGGGGGEAAAGGAGGGGMINPHNPEFLTKLPWYLANNADNAQEPTLEHQASQRLKEDRDLTLAESEAALAAQRAREKSDRRAFRSGQWVEALKKNKLPYRICQIIAVSKNKTEFDLRYEDGTIERRVKFDPRKQRQKTKKRPRIRSTRTGNRAQEASDNANVLNIGKETYDSKRDGYHGYDRDSHNTKVTARFEQREEMRRKLREQQQQQQQHKAKGDNTKQGDAATNGNTSGDDPDNNGKHDDNSDSDDDDDDDSKNVDDDEFVQRDGDAKVVTTRIARQGGVGGAQMKVTARNLRIREDTAKYLRNLDPNSAYYDPKSRSMRDNPTPHQGPEDEADYAGDNFARISGDAVGLAETQLFAWQASDRGVSQVHPQANPSQAELLKKQYQHKSTDRKRQLQKAVLDKYGGEQYLDGTEGLAAAAAAAAAAADNKDTPGMTEKLSDSSNLKGSNNEQKSSAANSAAVDRKVRFGVSTSVEEYSRDGRVVVSGKGTAAAARKSGGGKRPALECKYQEDIFINGHTTVWGSYFHMGAFSWGYADDHSLMKNSYCTGENGRKANDQANELRYGTGQAGSAALARAREMLKVLPKQQQGKADSSSSSSTAAAAAHLQRSKLYGETTEQFLEHDPAKVRAAMRKQERQERDELSEKKKRKYNSLADPSVTAEDMEAYRLRKEQKSDDPMARINNNTKDGEEGVLLEYK